MNYSKVNYVIVGAFVLAMLAGLVVVLAVLTGRTGATDDYHAMFQNVTGIKFGTQVVYEGFPIGQVEAVTPVPSEGAMRFRVDMSVTEGWRIPDDSVARIAAPGLLAAVTISIQAGRSPTALEPGAEIEAGLSESVFAAVSSLAADIRELSEKQIKPLLTNVNYAFASIVEIIDTEGRSMAKDLAGVVDHFADKAPGIINDVERTAESMKRVSRNLTRLLRGENRDRVENLLSELNTAADNFTAFSTKLDTAVTEMNAIIADNRGDIDESVADLRYILGSVARDIDAINQNLEAASRNMYEFSRQIRQNPGILMSGAAPRDADAER